MTTDADVELVRAFLNTLDVDDGTDVLAADEDWQAWAAERGLGPTGDVATAQQVRDALRAAATHPAPEADPRADEALASVPVHLRLDDEGLPTLAGADALSSVLAAVARLATTGRWTRLKICDADDCRWAYYDESRNGSRRWCSMQVCGNRTKTREFRRRRQAGAADGSGETNRAG